jgi:mycothiol synthase
MEMIMSETKPNAKIADHALASLHAKGFKTRPATFEDLPEAVEMFNAAERELHGNDIFTLERYEQEWRIPGFNLQTDTRVVLSPNGDLVGLVEVWDVLNPPVHPWLWARVDPGYQNQGIGSALMDWALIRARAAEARLEPDVRLAPRAGTITSHLQSTTLFKHFGMMPIRYGWKMRIEMASPPLSPRWPPAVSVRTFNYPDDTEAVFRAQDEAFQDHWGYVDGNYDEDFAQWKYSFFKIHAFDPELWFLAEDGDEIAGLAICYPHADEDPEMGWVEILCVRKPWRHQGLGLALLHHTFNVYYQRGLRRVGLGVDAQNLSGATRLYKKAGMKVYREHVTYEFEIRPGKELGNTG